MEQKDNNIVSVQEPQGSGQMHNLFLNMENRITRLNPFAVYSILFLLLAPVVFSEFIFKDLSFVNRGDGFTQHVRALLYYGRYLRAFIWNLINNHKLIAPQWDFRIGHGADILSALHYYAVGDPLNLLSAVFPDKYIGYCYTLISLLRVYFAGLFFLFFSNEIFEGKSKRAVMLGTLSFVFGFFAVNASGANVFDVDYIMYFPLLLLGLERIIRGKRGTVLTIAVFLAGIANFVLFSAIGILMAMYTVLRLIMEYRKDLPKGGRVLLKTAGSVLLGVGLAGAVLIPAGYSLFNNPRSGMVYKVLPFLPMDYVLEVPPNLLSGRDGSYGFMGFMLPLLVMSFGMKDRIVVFLRRMLIFLWIMFFIPEFSNIVNFFSGYERRWTFLFSILYSCILICVWDSCGEITKKQLIIAAIVQFIDLILCILPGSIDYVIITGHVATAFFMLLLYVTVLKPGRKSEPCNGGILLSAGVILVIIASNISMLHLEIEDGRYRKAGSLFERLCANESSLMLNELKGNTGGFNKYSGNIASNGSTTAGLSSTSYYWSNFSPESLYLRNDMEVMEFLVVDQSGYDHRSVISEVTGCNYYITDEDPARIPYGYDYVTEADINEDLRKYEGDVKEKIKTLYRNNDPLPFGYTYDNYLPYSEFKSAGVFNREQSMLTNVILNDEELPGSFEKGEIKDNVTEIPFKLSASDDIIIDGNRFIVYEPYAKLNIEFEPSTDMEAGMELRNIRFKPLRNIDRYFGDKQEYDPQGRFLKSDLKKMSPGLIFKMLWDDFSSLGTFTQARFDFYYGNEEKRFVQKTEYEKQFNHRYDVVLNLGFTGTDSVKLSFLKPGVYEFDLGVYNTSFEEYTRDVDRLKEYVLEGVNFGIDEVSGNIDLPEKKLLFLCLPYAEGWKAYVDGEETRIMKAHVMYSAIALDEGHHDIVLKYHTPMSRAGWIVTIFSSVLFLVYYVWQDFVQRKLNG